MNAFARENSPDRAYSLQPGQDVLDDPEIRSPIPRWGVEGDSNTQTFSEYANQFPYAATSGFVAVASNGGGSGISAGISHSMNAGCEDYSQTVAYSESSAQNVQADDYPLSFPGLDASAGYLAGNYMPVPSDSGSTISSQESPHSAFERSLDPFACLNMPVSINSQVLQDFGGYPQASHFSANPSHDVSETIYGQDRCPPPRPSHHVAQGTFLGPVALAADSGHVDPTSRPSTTLQDGAAESYFSNPPEQYDYSLNSSWNAALLLDPQVLVHDTPGPSSSSQAIEHAYEGHSNTCTNDLNDYKWITAEEVDIKNLMFETPLAEQGTLRTDATLLSGFVPFSHAHIASAGRDVPQDVGASPPTPVPSPPRYVTPPPVLAPQPLRAESVPSTSPTTEVSVICLVCLVVDEAYMQEFISSGRPVSTDCRAPDHLKSEHQQISQRVVDLVRVCCNASGRLGTT